MAKDEKGFERQARLAGRVLDLTGRPGLPVVVAIVAPENRVRAEAYLQAVKKLETAKTDQAREAREAREALAPLAQEHDLVRGVVLAKCPDVDAGQSSSRYATQDDLLHAAELLEDVLEQRPAEEWAAQLLATFSPRLDVAAREWAESLAAGSALQKAQAARREAAAALEAGLVDFRRVVRGAFGSTSKEYHSLKAFQGRKSEGEGEPTPQPA